MPVVAAVVEAVTVAVILVEETTTTLPTVTSPAGVVTVEPWVKLVPVIVTVAAWPGTSVVGDVDVTLGALSSTLKAQLLLLAGQVADWAGVSFVVTATE